MTNFTQAIPMTVGSAKILKRNLLVLIQQYVVEARNPRLSAEERALALIEATNLGDIVDLCDTLITRNKAKEMAA